MAGSDVEPYDPGAGRDRAVDRRRQRQHRPQQPLLRQLAPRDDAVRRARRDDLRPRPIGDAGHRAATRRKISTSYNNQFYGNIDGRRARRQPCSPTARTSGGTPTRQHRQLLVRQHAGAGQVDHDVAAPLPDCRDGTDPGSSIGTGDPGQRGRALGCLLAYGELQPEPLPVVPDTAQARDAGRERAGGRAARAPAPGVPGVLRPQPDDRACASRSSNRWGTCEARAHHRRVRAGARRLRRRWREQGRRAKPPGSGFPWRRSTAASGASRARTSARPCSTSCTASTAARCRASDARRPMGRCSATRRPRACSTRYCARSYAGHFTIYKIYARAAAFVGTAP